MSDIALVKCEDMTIQEAENLKEALEPVTEEENIRFIVTTADIEPMDEEDAKEMLGHFVSILGYELEHGP